MELKNEHFGKYVTSILKVLKRDSAESWKSLFGQIG
jgi:hypothetical protein